MDLHMSSKKSFISIVLISLVSICASSNPLREANFNNVSAGYGFNSSFGGGLFSSSGIFGLRGTIELSDNLFIPLSYQSESGNLEDAFGYQVATFDVSAFSFGAGLKTEVSDSMDGFASIRLISGSGEMIDAYYFYPLEIKSTALDFGLVFYDLERNFSTYYQFSNTSFEGGSSQSFSLGANYLTDSNMTVGFGSQFTTEFDSYTFGATVGFLIQ